MAKARKSKLKVFRTPVGFHDAYVAAPSQKAALEAWGSDSNLFAAGAAELVTEPELTAVPLARPGEVIKVMRGTKAEQVAALGKAGGAKPAKSKTPNAVAKPKAKKPDSAALDAAEAQVERLKRAQARALVAIDKEIAAVERRRRELERKQRRELDAAEEEAARQRAIYQRDRDRWRGQK